jgi:hypothetical protein
MTNIFKTMVELQHKFNEQTIKNYLSKNLLVVPLSLSFRPQMITRIATVSGPALCRPSMPSICPIMVSMPHAFLRVVR